jgi:hypothetical protein
MTVNESTFRMLVLLLLTIAVAVFGYNQVAQARGVRFRPLDEFRYINTWTGEYCRFSGGCRALARSTQNNLPSVPIDTVDKAP